MNTQLKNLAAKKSLDSLPKILVAASECTPLAKTGGLADVVGTLPASLRELGFDARIIIPCHKVIKDKYRDRMSHITDFIMDLGWRRQYVGVELMMLGKVPVYLIDSEFYFGNKIYADGQFGTEQYAYFCRAVLEALKRIDFAPDVIHCNDWHTAAIPMLLKTQYKNTRLGKIRSIFTIHNIAYQGQIDLGFLGDVLGVHSRYMSWEYLEMYGCGNLMKGACIFADKINTVSPSYAKEILTDEYGEGLQVVLRECTHKLSGIVNGIDLKFFDPETDPALCAHYSSGNIVGKKLCKEALCSELGIDSTKPLIAMVTRMTAQKGFDLIIPTLDKIMAKDLSFVLLGTGDKEYEDFMRQAEGRYPGRLKAVLSYNEDLSHRIYAAADLFLMPSRFEPCGISQMLAMRYGALPIVRETGGLRDTVKPHTDPYGTGFRFSGFDCWEMLSAIDTALAAYGNEETFRKLIKNAMDCDFGFTASAIEYGKLYLDTI